MSDKTNSAANPTTTKSSTSRLMSVDALRGFDMFWIVGAGSLVGALHQVSKTGPVNFLATQLEHVEWQGFRFYDLIFPLFVFIVGVSMVFSLSKTIAQVGRAAALARVFRRSILMFILALFYSGGFSNEWPNIRLLGVLNRIALCYFFAGLIFCFCRPRQIVAICIGLLLGYWALMAWVPIRDIQLEKASLEKLAERRGTTNVTELFYQTTNTITGKYAPGLNLANHLDFQYLPGRRWDTYYDPEGYLSTLPAIATCLLGVFAGFLLMNQSLPDTKKVTYLLVAGMIGVGLGWLWGTQFPVVKKIWTSSYVLVAGGYSAILLGTFYLIVDVWKFQAWCQPFVWIGMNSITIYMVNNILGGFRRIAERLVGGDVKNFLNTTIGQGFGELVVALVGLLLVFWFVNFLYRKKIFLRL